MPHVDALSRQPLPNCLVIDREEEGIMVRLKRAQREDTTLRKIFEAFQEGHLDGYVVRNDVLFKEVNNEFLLVVPASMQTQIIRRTHERGHFSVGKTLLLLQREYWFPNMNLKIEKAIRNCVPCILANKKQGKQEGLLHPIDKGDAPLQTYHIDHLGPVPSTRKNYKHVFVVTDAFSKFVWLYATRSTSTAEAIKRLQKQSAVFGNPKRIVSDRGTAFTSQDFEHYCIQENIQHIKITTGVPRGNGQVERVNRTLIPLITKLSAAKPEEWFKHLDTAQKFINSIPHRSTGMTPFKLLFGTEMRLREDPAIREILEEEITARFQEDRDELREKAREQIFRIQQENRRGYNRKRKKARPYKEGDLVAIQRTQSQPGAKFTSKFLGPYEVTRELRHDRYLVRRVGDHEGPLQTSTSADHMKPWFINDSQNEDDEDFEDSNESVGDT
ncbi:Pro-Pol polyprotein [Anthophora plagiata]